MQARMLGGASFLPPLKAGMRIVEVGCGTGAIAREVADRVASGEVVGIDRDEQQLDVARALADERGMANLRFVRGQASALALPDNAFDGTYCRFLLEHVPDPVAVVREMARVVRPGGWVCAYEWQNGSSAVYPPSPAVEEVWRAVYRLQDLLGGDSAVAPKLYGILRKAGLDEVHVQAQAWTWTAEQKEQLRRYVGGAKEIIDQARDQLLDRGLLAGDTLRRADSEYGHLLEAEDAFVLEVMCRAVGNATA